VLEFVATGGYALAVYERFRRLKRGADGLWRLADHRLARRYRMNVGTIVEAPMLRVRLKNRRQVLGEIEEAFVSWLAPGDVFQFAGRALRFERIRETFADVTLAPSGSEPTVASYQGTRMAFTTHLADRVRGYLAEPARWHGLPGEVLEWLELQRRRSILPKAEELLIETFPRSGREFLVVYSFVGWNAHQTLGMLLTRRLERARARPLGFVANEYALAVWGLGDLGRMIGAGSLSLAALFDQDMLGDDLDAWLAESNLMKRTFRACAVIAGLIDRRHPGREKSGRQLTVSSDLIYDVLLKHEPDHILMRAAWADAASGLLDIARLGEMLKRVRGRIVHKDLDRVSPLAVPVMLEIGREPVFGAAQEELLAEAAEDLVGEAMRVD
jgi:ATP-dependent Lhr-like helicase